MSLISDTILDKIEAKGLKLEDFRRVCHRLLANQVIYAEASKVERDVYNLFCRLQEEVEEYLDVLGFHIYHDKVAGANFVALFAPGARSPAVDTAEEEKEIAGLRRKLDPDSIKLLLVCRHLYEQGMKEGKGIDENNCVNVSIQVLNQSYQTLLGEAPPRASNRNAIFREINSLRVIDGNQDDWNDFDAWIKVRPVISSMVFNEMVSTIASGLPMDTERTELNENNATPLLHALDDD